ncbi:MAG TPA: type II secretion system F family protein [Microbacteriaceae bacterium]|nr:type II secretion system F family protein [Microbacteriaceae bacterium]
MNPVGFVFGALLAGAVLLVVTPWLWPRRRDRRASGTLRELLHQAGFHRARIEHVLGLTVLFGLAGGGLLGFVTGVTAIGVVAFLAGCAAPIAWMRRRAARRRLRRAAVWPDVFDHLISALRSGLTVPDALSSLATNGPALLRDDFTSYVRAIRADVPWDDALRLLQDRFAEPIADQLCETLRISRTLGGNRLVPVLSSSALALRERIATDAEIRARQSWITNAAWLGAAAPWLVLVLLNLRPEARAAFNTSGGTALILSGAGASVLAIVIMRRIARGTPSTRWVRRS